MTVEEIIKQYEGQPILDIVTVLSMLKNKTYENKTKLLQAINKHNLALAEDLQRKNTDLENKVLMADDCQDCLPLQPEKKADDLPIPLFTTQFAFININEYLRALRATDDIGSKLLRIRNLPNFRMLTREIILAFLTEMVDSYYRSFNTNISIEEREMYWQEYQSLKTKIEDIKEWLEDLEYPVKYDKDKTPTSRVMILTSERSESYLQADIEGLDRGTYNWIIRVLRKIQRGDFTGAKGITIIPGLCELRYDDIRVIFRHTDNNVCLILGVFLKKARKISQYAEFMTRRHKIYESQKDTILASTKSHQDLDFHQTLFSGAMTTLSLGKGEVR